MQHKAILERRLPDTLKLEIAKKIENNLFSKVVHRSQHVCFSCALQRADNATSCPIARHLNSL